MRARSVLAAAEDLARAADAAVIGSDHLAAGLMAEPDGLAAKAIVALGVSARQLRAAPGLPEATATAEGEPSAERVPLGPGAVAALMAALRQALHLGHNYIGTPTLAGLGVTKPAAEQQLAAAFAALQASRNQPGSG
jgi:ATP-dependent Clp protease ATP-binding subunit ClpA